MAHHHHHRHPASPSANLNITSDFPGTPSYPSPLFHLRRAVLERGDMVSFFGFQSVHFLTLARAALAKDQGWRRWPVLWRPDFLVRFLVLGFVCFATQLGLNVQLAGRFYVEDLEVRDGEGKGREVEKGLWRTMRSWMGSDVGFVVLVGCVLPWFVVTAMCLSGSLDVQVVLDPKVWLLWVSVVMLLLGLRMTLQGGEEGTEAKGMVGLENGGDSPGDTSDDAGKATKGILKKKGKARKAAKKKRNTLTF